VYLGKGIVYRVGEDNGRQRKTYVKPVDRFMPARNADTGSSQHRSFRAEDENSLRTASNA
jgi:hypothetical protein